MVKPQEIHWNVAKVVHRYLKGTLDYGIKYIDTSNVELTGYLDSDWYDHLNHSICIWNWIQGCFMEE
jgi:hypothetical protein